ncbi:MAG TPA: S8 family serine peptidase, partial [Candidatus Acidoferrales bacterium]|nr:S8 family serine peptidase [Candidatus Acidoferrales bacterium]
MRSPSLKGLLIRSASDAPLRIDIGREFSLLGARMSLEPLFKNTGPIADLGLGESPQWYLAQVPPALAEANPWDVAHQALGEALAFAAGPEGVYIEPDLEQQFLACAEEPEALAAKGHVGEQDPQDPAFPRGPGFAWFLKPDFSQLAAARQGGGANVRIAHLDTGYDPAHGTRPQNLLSEFENDFVDNDRDAHDPGIDGLLKNPGHGTGTLSILAGNKVSDLGNDFLGGAPLAEIIPVRIATSVILFRTHALARALDYVIAPSKRNGETLGPVNVVTLSMGGLASGAWADAVNRAYQAGICIVAAAGNNISAGIFPIPTRFIVYPARFRRVIAACGVMANRAPYYGLGLGKMQGNFGPQSKMATAMAAYTPNMPWAEIGYPAIVDMNGAGTSSATPQIAATAALWIEKYRNELSQYREPWQRVEAVRHALFTSADKSADGGSNEKLGNGILHAEAALQIQPPDHVTQTPRDSAAFSFLRVLTGLGAREEPARTQMFALEITQLAQQWDQDQGANPFDSILPDPDLPQKDISQPKVREFLEAMIEHPRASSALKEHLKFALGVKPPRRPPGGPGKPALAKGAAPQPVPAAIPQPIYRRLRGYAFDPSLKLQLDTEPISEITFQVPWETLEPGPRGEYLDVVDMDPASKCFYDPVNLDHPHLLAQDGLAASEGTPQFHQQMAYVVASLAIQNFEHALGRKVLWAPGPSPDPENPHDDSYYIPRLRIYPHAMREANAYYSPAKKALLFGYFMASADDPGDHLPGGLVFTCLSHDIVAHETSHALLDGMHRRFTQPTNPDVRAFHEAFADIVALLQHFTFPEILRHQIARTRGEIRSQENLLGQLAGQFGRASGGRGALRDAIGRYNPETQAWEPRKPDPLEYERTTEPHARGAIL